MECRFINLHGILWIGVTSRLFSDTSWHLGHSVRFHLSSTTSTLRMLDQTAGMRDHLDAGLSLMRYDFTKLRKISIYKNIKRFASWLSDLHLSIKKSISTAAVVGLTRALKDGRKGLSFC